MEKNFGIIGLIVLASMSVGLVACGGDDDEPDFVVTPSSVSLYYDGTQQLTAEGATSWTSRDEFIASVDQNGLVNARHIGTTQIVVNNGRKTATCEVLIKPKYLLFNDPLLLWGSSKASIQSSESHSIIQELNNDKYLAYDYTLGTTACIMIYMFENGSLKAVMAMLNKSSYTDAGYYLLERYQPISIGDDNEIYFADAMTLDKAKTACVLDYSDLNGSKYTAILFMDISSINSSTRGFSNKIEIPEDIISVIQKEFAK